MKNGLTLLFSLVLLSPNAFSESHLPFLGKWKLSTPPANLPQACHNASMHFIDHAKVTVFDGAVEAQFGYTAEKNASGKGYNLIVKSIAYSGDQNCAGSSIKNIPKGKLQFYFAQVSEDRKSMRIYESEKDFLLYQRID